MCDLRLRSFVRNRRPADENCRQSGDWTTSERAKVLSIITIAVIGWLASLSGAADTWAQAPSRLERAASEVIAASLNYRMALERVLAIYERDVARHAELAELRRDLFEREVLSKEEFERTQEAHAQAQRSLEETRAALAEADRMLLEARTAEALARLTPLSRGSYEETPGLARFNGLSAWSLAVDTPRLQRFFQERFGRVLPISAFGQTALHERMGFDHRNALDLALHPDSAEGRALMEHLRSLGIPFIAAWGAVPGSASGAHIHVGQPSPRVSTRRCCQ